MKALKPTLVALSCFATFAAAFAAVRSARGTEANVGTRSPARQVSASPIDPTTIPAEEFLSKLLTPSDGYVSVVCRRTPTGTNTVEALVAPTTILCGDAKAQATSFETSPGCCGDTELAAKMCAVTQVLGQLCDGYVCQECITAGACTISVATLPDFWTIAAYKQFNPGSPCYGKYEGSASYWGPIIVSCTACPID